jgi:hypothetical protein
MFLSMTGYQYSDTVTREGRADELEWPWREFDEPPGKFMAFLVLAAASRSWDQQRALRARRRLLVGDDARAVFLLG